MVKMINAKKNDSISKRFFVCKQKKHTDFACCKETRTPSNPSTLYYNVYAKIH